MGDTFRKEFSRGSKVNAPCIKLSNKSNIGLGLSNYKFLVPHNTPKDECVKIIKI
jgi:hypothetical protein